MTRVSVVFSKLFGFAKIAALENDQCVSSFISKCIVTIQEIITLIGHIWWDCKVCSISFFGLKFISIQGYLWGLGSLVKFWLNIFDEGSFRLLCILTLTTNSNSLIVRCLKVSKLNLQPYIRNMWRGLDRTDTWTSLAPRVCDLRGSQPFVVAAYWGLIFNYR